MHLLLLVAATYPDVMNHRLSSVARIKELNPCISRQSRIVTLMFVKNAIKDLSPGDDAPYFFFPIRNRQPFLHPYQLEPRFVNSRLRIDRCQANGPVFDPTANIMLGPKLLVMRWQYWKLVASIADAYSVLLTISQQVTYRRRHS